MLVQRRGPGHQHNPHHNPQHNQTHRQGNAHRGRTYRNFVYRNGWQGWTNRRWSVSRNCWMFWCPNTCWYTLGDDGVYVPCDECTDPNADD